MQILVFPRIDLSVHFRLWPHINSSDLKKQRFLNQKFLYFVYLVISQYIIKDFAYSQTGVIMCKIGYMQYENGATFCHSVLFLSVS